MREGHGTAPTNTLRDHQMPDFTVPTSASRSPRNVEQLRWTEEDGHVTVTPRDEDRFTIKLNRAVDILQQANQREAFSHQFQVLLRTLVAWLRSHQKQVQSAYLTQRDGVLSFVVVCSSCEYDDEFEDSLSDLDFDIARDADLDLIKMNALSLPKATDAAIASFLDEQFTLQLLGEGPDAD